jgi:intracellular sulfur oxidation DsrE/DsrF family protein
MMNNQNFSDELLNSFVDNELELDEKNELFNAISHDDTLKERVCELRCLKEMVHHAYRQPPACRVSPTKKMGNWQLPYIQNTSKLAACVLLLLLGWGSGWVMSARSQSANDLKLLSLFQATQRSDIAERPNSIIVHISSSNPVRLKSALDETESLLAANKRANRQFKVEIIANEGGVNLLRSDVSPFAKRIALMRAKYPNLDYLACQQTINKLQRQGIIVKLLPHTGFANSAVEQIDKRLHQGWDYVRV